jgi:hypothetical protein
MTNSTPVPEFQWFQRSMVGSTIHTMKRETAQSVVNALRQASSLVSMTIEDVRLELPQEEFKRYTKFVGEILGSSELDLMAPIIREHPELDPDRK